MASRDATVLTERAFRELRLSYWQQQRQLKNLTARLASLSKGRRHEVRYGPPRVRFKNESSETVPAWGIVRITDASSQDYLKVAKVDATYRWLYLVNGPKDVAADGYGYGHYLTSETFSFKHNRVLYDTGSTPAYGQRWGPKVDSFLLWQHRPGFFILGGITGSGSTARVVAIQLPPGEVRVQNDSGSAIAAGGSGTVGIYGGAAGITDTGLEVTVTNGSSTSWATTKYGWATADAGGLIFVAPHQT